MPYPIQNSGDPCFMLKSLYRVKKATPLSLLLLISCGGNGSNAPEQQVNRPPVVSQSNTDQSAVQGQFIEYDATQNGQTFSDADGDNLTYTVSFSPSSLGLTATAGVIQGTPSLSGETSVTITASDGRGGLNEDQFSINVIEDDPIGRVFGSKLDLADLSDYAGQSIPDYISRTNSAVPVTNSGATLGRVLFYDKSLSADGTISCASCHNQSSGFTNSATPAENTNKPMRLVNLSTDPLGTFFWDREEEGIAAALKSHILDGKIFGFSNDQSNSFEGFLTTIAEKDYYKELFEFVFTDEAVTESRILTSLSEFVYSIESFDSKYDAGRSQVSDDTVPFPNFTDGENAGKALFMQKEVTGSRQEGAGCNVCHTAPTFQLSDRNGINGVTYNFPDVDTITGGFAVTRSPSLRNLFQPDGSENAPFMHNGSFPTITDVLNHYETGIVIPGQPYTTTFRSAIDPRFTDVNSSFGSILQVEFSDVEKQYILDFLKTLSGTDIYTNEAFSDPFLATQP